MNDILWYEITNLQGFICCKWFWNLLPCKYNMVCMCHFVLFLRKNGFRGPIFCLRFHRPHVSVRTISKYVSSSAWLACKWIRRRKQQFKRRWGFLGCAHSQAITGEHPEQPLAGPVQGSELGVRLGEPEEDSDTMPPLRGFRHGC